MSSSSTQNAGRQPRRRWIQVVVALALVAIVAAVAGPFVYIHFIKDDPPAKLSLDDVPAAAAAATGSTAATSTVAAASTSGTPAPGTIAPGTIAAVTTPDAAATATTRAAAPGGSAESGSADGSYVLTPDSQAGYRVVEVLFGQNTEGVGRTNSVTGSITVAGAQVTSADFTVDMATLRSDEDRRDAKFTGEIMETSTFPTATFVITQPIELGTEPADGTEVSATATGDLTLHGVTRSVTLDVTAKKTGTSIAIAGSTDVTFIDYDIANPSNPAITTEDHGLIEFLLVAVKS